MKNQDSPRQDVAWTNKKEDEFQKGKLEVKNINNLIGKILTLIDASVDDEKKQEALKSILKETIWDWATDWKIFATEEQIEEIQKEAKKVDPFDPIIEFAGWENADSTY